MRSWQWQKILCKKQEAAQETSELGLEGFRRFGKFRELGSGEGDIRVKAGGFHVDMGDLFRYLASIDILGPDLVISEVLTFIQRPRKQAPPLPLSKKALSLSV